MSKEIAPGIDIESTAKLLIKANERGEDVFCDFTYMGRTIRLKSKNATYDSIYR